MKKISKRIILSILTVIISISLNLPSISFAEQISNDVITISMENFPDENFLSYIESNFDINKDGKLNQEEISKVTYIYVNMKGIKTLKGIEYFKNLKYLYAEVNYIKELDLSQNKNLVVVYCNNNMINSIKLPNQEVNNTLEILNVFDNRLENINLENLKSLKYLNLGYNQFKVLDLSNNPLGDGPGFAASDNYLEKITLPNNGTEYEWLSFLAPQLYPKDKSIGYKVNWYLDEGKTQLIDPNTVKTIKCVGQTLYAEYVPITYTVEFNSNNGMAETKTQKFVYGTTQKLFKNEFTKKDYYFAGWKDEKGRVYNDESEVINLTDVDGKVLKLTAVWKEVDYTGQEYTINLHDGESVVTVKGKYGESAILPKNESTKEDYDFIGWNFGTGDYGIFSDGGKVLMTHPDDLNGVDNTLNLYSVWKKKEFTVNFIDTQNSYKKIVQYNDRVAFPVAPTKEGYTFEGWVTESGEKWDEQSSVTSNLDLYANYSPIKYSVSFDGNGADNEDAMNNIKIEMDYSKQAILPTNLYEKNSYTLQGWSTTKNGNAEFNDEDIVYQLTTENDKNVTLYAVWEKYYADSTVTITTSSLDKIYDGKKVLNPSVNNTGSTNEVKLTWYELVGLEYKVMKEAPINAGQYKVVASVEADDNYKAASDELEFKITKAIPTYENITELNASYGDTLKNVALPEGFTWQEDLSTSVGNVGKNTFKVNYTKKDTTNYETVKNIEVTVNVKQATNSWIKSPSIKGWKYGEENNKPVAQAKFGEVVFTYSSLKNGQFTSVVPTKAGTWYMKASVKGNKNYTGLEKVVLFEIEEKPTENKPNTDNDTNANIPNKGEEILRPGLDIRAGERRYDTAVELSKSKFDKADTVVIAGGYALADGLTATPIATEYKAPLLLVEKNNIPEATKNEIKRLGAKNVIIVGGTTVINKTVESQLLSLGVSKITRLGGNDRYETSLLVAKYIDSNLYDIENIVVTNGLGEADALSISPVSGRDRMPIILVRSNNVPSSLYNWLSKEGIKNAYIIGGETAINDTVLKQINKITTKDISGNRLGGSTRYETNAFIIDKFYGLSTNKVYVSKGLQLIDALSSGPIAALDNAPVVLANNDLTATQRSILSKRSTNTVVQAGHGIPNNVLESLRDALTSK